MEFIERPDFLKRGIIDDPTIEKVFIDSTGSYIVEKHSVKENLDFAFSLTIKRIDKKTIRSWRILQNIKNAIAGEDSVAIEIYPRESEVTDTGNLYHLWVFRSEISVKVKIIPPVVK
ncbi:MAG: hypothetical protein JXA96_17800 [Sedimentisphaerales bacterium]|nr:hypothetical protein [Sedimentisphaerales bacterium]